MTTDPSWKLTVFWALTAYVFLLRVPSECLPIVTGDGRCDNGQNQATIVVKETCIELALMRRKNRPEGCVLRR